MHQIKFNIRTCPTWAFFFAGSTHFVRLTLHRCASWHNHKLRNLKQFTIQKPNKMNRIKFNKQTYSVWIIFCAESTYDFRFTPFGPSTKKTSFFLTASHFISNPPAWPIDINELLINWNVVCKLTINFWCKRTLVQKQDQHCEKKNGLFSIQK